MTKNLETSITLQRLSTAVKSMNGTAQLLGALLVGTVAMTAVLLSSYFMVMFYGLYLVVFGSGATAWKARSMSLLFLGLAWLVLK